MDEIELGVKLEEHFAIPGLQVQVVQNEEELVVVFNRPDQEHLNYSELTKKTVSKLSSLHVPPPKEIIFYSRVLGEEATDWDTTVKIKVKEPVLKPEKTPLDIPKITSPPEDTSSFVKPTNEPIKEQREASQIPVEQPELTAETITPVATTPRNLSDFCFTRNKALIKTDLPAPDRKIAENVKFFDQLNESIQLELAPVLEDFFKNPDKTSLISVPTELRGWFEDLKKLKDIEFKSQAVWLSRYCYDREKTMTEVNALLESLAEIEQAKQKQFEPTPAPVKARSPERLVVSSSSRTVSDKPRGSQKFTPDELVFMIGGGLLIGAIGWFLWGTAAALSVFGWVAAIAGIASGIGTILGNQGIKTAAATILIIIYVIFFGVGFIILWIEFLGWLTGLILGGAVSSMVQSSGAESITAPKPFRLLVVLTIVILIGMGYAMTTSSSRQAAEMIAPGTTGTPLETVEVVITDQQITMSNSALKTSFAMKVENKSSKTCELDFDLVSSGGYRVTYDQSPEIEKGQTKTINFNFSNGGLFQLNCEADAFNPNYLELQGPKFTIRDK